MLKLADSRDYNLRIKRGLRNRVRGNPTGYCGRWGTWLHNADYTYSLRCNAKALRNLRLWHAVFLLFPPRATSHVSLWPILQILGLRLPKMKIKFKKMRVLDSSCSLFHKWSFFLVWVYTVVYVVRSIDLFCFFKYRTDAARIPIFEIDPSHGVVLSTWIDNTVIIMVERERRRRIDQNSKRDSITSSLIPGIYHGALIPAINSSTYLVTTRLPGKQSLVCQPVSKRSRIVMRWRRGVVGSLMFRQNHGSTLNLSFQSSFLPLLFLSLRFKWLASVSRKTSTDQKSV